MIEHLFYPPDLVMSNSWLFLNLNRLELYDYHFQSEDAIEELIKTYFSSILKYESLKAFSLLKVCLQKYIDPEKYHFEHT